MESMLKQAVNEHREAILARWIECALASYPADSARFLREQRDPFHNPVGRALADSVGALLDAAVAGTVNDAAAEALDAILRMRAVQELEPEDALRFLLGLREIVRTVLAGRLGEYEAAELARLDRGVDGLALAGFAVYLRCREQVWRIRTDEIRRRSTKVMERLDLWRAVRDGGDAGDR